MEDRWMIAMAKFGNNRKNRKKSKILSKPESMASWRSDQGRFSSSLDRRASSPATFFLPPSVRFARKATSLAKLQLC
jgi:hypothetical protein